MTGLSIQSIDRVAGQLALALKSVADLHGDCVLLLKHVRGVQGVVQASIDDLEDRALNQRDVATALQGLHDALSQCLVVARDLAGKDRAAKFFRSGDLLARTKSASSQLARALGALQAALGPELARHGPLLEAFEGVRAALQHYRPESLLAMHHDAGLLRERLEALQAAWRMPSAVRHAETWTALVGCVRSAGLGLLPGAAPSPEGGPLSAQEVQVVTRSLRRELLELRREEQACEARYLGLLIDTLERGEPDGAGPSPSHYALPPGSSPPPLPLPPPPPSSPPPMQVYGSPAAAARAPSPGRGTSAGGLALPAAHNSPAQSPRRSPPIAYRYSSPGTSGAGAAPQGSLQGSPHRGPPPLVLPSFLCPLTRRVMRDPVVLVESGRTFERAALEYHLSCYDTDPVTNAPLRSKAVTTNHNLRSTIEEWLQSAGLTIELCDAAAAQVAAAAAAVASPRRGPHEVPHMFICPLTGRVMRDPVVLVETGRSYDRSALEQHLASHNTDPRSGAPLRAKTVRPDHKLRHTLEGWLRNTGLTPQQADAVAGAPEDPPQPPLPSAAGPCSAEDGDTVLHVAAYAGNAEVVAQLLEQGVDIRAQGKASRTPLHAAACQGHEWVVRALLQAGAGINKGDAVGNTPLHAAAAEGRMRVVDLLLTAGASAGTRNKDGYTARDIARQWGHRHTAAMLLAHEVSRLPSLGLRVYTLAGPGTLRLGPAPLVQTTLRRAGAPTPQRLTPADLALPLSPEQLTAVVQAAAIPEDALRVFAPGSDGATHEVPSALLQAGRGLELSYGCLVNAHHFDSPQRVYPSWQQAADGEAAFAHLILLDCCLPPPHLPVELQGPWGAAPLGWVEVRPDWGTDDLEAAVRPLLPPEHSGDCLLLRIGKRRLTRGLLLGAELDWEEGTLVVQVLEPDILITVRDTCGRRRDVAVHKHMSVLDLKRRVEAAWADAAAPAGSGFGGAPVPLQRLIFGGRTLGEGELLAQCGVAEGCVVLLVLGLRKPLVP
ncbi:hypothetical protein HYH03_013804 [Edaphochlamys debaryana]|uniref:RING-type E3 ubiquitin transferase n=1 Tax=Edaphochlamys debaryana TaxID=47281 RepID=A0A835XRA9_9CHLO|nr:hypothetical protein HYH03_013804 [Edaphochlamys debaryana]|eukprot:KAG2487523.1 hypothetical protein HYH03_013804 [Edaphochlamys debaryana]